MLQILKNSVAFQHHGKEKKTLIHHLLMFSNIPSHDTGISFFFSVCSNDDRVSSVRERKSLLNMSVAKFSGKQSLESATWHSHYAFFIAHKLRMYFYYLTLTDKIVQDYRCA